MNLQLSQKIKLSVGTSTYIWYPPSERFMLSGVKVSDRNNPAPAEFTFG